MYTTVFLMFHKDVLQYMIFPLDSEWNRSIYSIVNALISTYQNTCAYSLSWRVTRKHTYEQQKMAEEKRSEFFKWRS